MITDKNELEARNQNIIYLNNDEFALKQTLNYIKKYLNLDLPNITSIIINKNFHFENLFYNQNLNYHYKSATGNAIFLYLITINNNAMKVLKKAIEVETKRMKNNSIFPIGNKYLKKYYNMVKEVENFKLDDSLIDKLYSLNIKQELIMCLYSMQLELIVLNGIEYSDFCIKRLVDLAKSDTNINLVKSNHNINDDKKNNKSKKLVL